MSTQLTAIDKLLTASENTLRSVDVLTVEIMSLKQEHTSIKADVIMIKEHMTVDSRFQQNILASAKKHITKILGGKESEFYKDYSGTIRTMWADYRQFFGITSYKDTRVNDYNDAMRFINNWQPHNTET